jgi:signal peptidase I
MTWWLLPSAIALSIGGLAVWLRRTFLVVTVDGPSMSPTLVPGDRVLVRRGLQRIGKGSIVVVSRPDPDRGWKVGARHTGAVGTRRWFIKRVVALPGETVTSAAMPVVVPEHHVYLLGDYTRSADSRQFGPCPTEQILGKVVHRYTRRGGTLQHDPH